MSFNMHSQELKSKFLQKEFYHPLQQIQFLEVSRILGICNNPLISHLVRKRGIQKHGQVV
jgi:hypothetical protein